VLSGRGLCDELITRPGESYRLWCVVVCDLKNLKNEEAINRVGSQRHRKQNTLLYIKPNSCYITAIRAVHNIIHYYDIKSVKCLTNVIIVC
jgi:hypothetical protein